MKDVFRFYNADNFSFKYWDSGSGYAFQFFLFFDGWNGFPDVYSGSHNEVDFTIVKKERGFKMPWYDPLTASQMAYLCGLSGLLAGAVFLWAVINYM